MPCNNNNQNETRIDGFGMDTSIIDRFTANDLDRLSRINKDTGMLKFNIEEIMNQLDSVVTFNDEVKRIEYSPLEKASLNPIELGFLLNEKGEYYLDELDLRTVFDFDLSNIGVGEIIRKDLIDFISGLINEDFDNDAYSYSTRINSNLKLFYVIESDVFVYNRFNKYRGDSHYVGFKILRHSSSRIITYYPDQYEHLRCEENNRLLRVFIHDFFLEDKFTTKTYYDVDLDRSGYQYSITYHKEQLVLCELVDEITNVTYFKSKCNYVHPNDYHSFNVCEDDPKMGQFSYRGRVTKLKLGKCIRKLFKISNEHITDEEVKRIVNRFSGVFDGYELKVVEGDDIDKYYLYSNYSLEYPNGSLGSSCMRYQKCIDEDFFKIYKDNCKMLVLLNEETDLILGRAILWEASDEHREDFLVMDRIYGSEKAYILFFDWAKKNGYYRKKYQSHDSTDEFINPDGLLIYKEFLIDISLNDYRKVPYMDTFAWGDNDQISNIYDYGYYSARDTEGGLDGRYDDDNYYNDECKDW